MPCLEENEIIMIGAVDWVYSRVFKRKELEIWNEVWVFDGLMLWLFYLIFQIYYYLRSKFTFGTPRVNNKLLNIF